MDTPLPDGFTARAPALDAPGGTLQRADGPGGIPGLVVRFRADLAGHPMLQKGLDEIAEFLGDPGVPGVLPLIARDREHATLAYEIGDGVLLAALINQCARAGVVPGERAAIELVAKIGPLLDAAAEAGGPVGVYSHGGLNPWRIVVYPDGEVALLGYGVPPVEVVTWLDEDTDEPPGPGFRYSPPERVQDDSEDIRSDLYGLAAIAAELARGAPLLAGPPNELVDRILAGEAATRLDALSPAVRAFLEPMLAKSRADRPRTGARAARDAKALARTLGGRPLGALARGAYDEWVPAVIEAATASSATPAPGRLSGVDPGDDPSGDPHPTPVPAAPELRPLSRAAAVGVLGVPSGRRLGVRVHGPTVGDGPEIVDLDEDPDEPTDDPPTASDPEALDAAWRARLAARAQATSSGGPTLVTS
ncbi:MAG: hypothetical protein ABMB14_30080, partial [Myxococcota bacterium]